MWIWMCQLRSATRFDIRSNTSIGPVAGLGAETLERWPRRGMAGGQNGTTPRQKCAALDRPHMPPLACCIAYLLRREPDALDDPAPFLGVGAHARGQFVRRR